MVGYELFIRKIVKVTVPALDSPQQAKSMYYIKAIQEQKAEVAKVRIK